MMSKVSNLIKKQQVSLVDYNPHIYTVWTKLQCTKEQYTVADFKTKQS